MEMRTVSSVSELVEMLGGPTAAAEKLDATPQKIVNWRATKALPARKYLVQRDMLRRCGIEAPAALWGITDPALSEGEAA